MLTIIAWVVFVLMSVWNITFWSVFFMREDPRSINWKTFVVEAAVTIGLWVIPGVYLFGVF